MLDKEMIRYCAIAMGYRLSTGPDDNIYVEEYQLPGIPLSGLYNPIEDDDDAMELVKTFGLSLDAPIPNKNDKWFVMGADGRTTFSKNLNRAIVEYIALLQQRKNERQSRSQRG